MSLSVCMITADPPARVAAILEPLLPIADEVIIAADSRVGEDTLVGYGALADRLFKIECVLPERHLAWLCAQCSHEWILRLDGDEVPSRAFIRRLPELLASRSVQQYWIRRVWLHSDASHILAQAPWSEDFVNRLTRNDGTLRLIGQQHTHAEPVSPREYIEQPLYHLDLLTSSRQQRLDKVVRYESFRPHLLAAGGGRLNEAFYLPELRDSLAWWQVPEEDRAALVQALEGSMPPLAPASLEGVSVVSLAEMDRTSASFGKAPAVSLAAVHSVRKGRGVCADACRATIEPPQPTISLAPAERRQIFFRVRNEGSEHWPESLEAWPPIRLSYHWLHLDGSVHTAEGQRSPFPRVVAPGESVLAPVHVDAPAAAGDYVLDVHVIHEHVQRFDRTCRIPVRVADPHGLPPAGARLTETVPVHLRRWRRMRIPTTIHRVWLGGDPLPDEHERFGRTFAHHHPDWEMRLWTEEDFPVLGIGDADCTRARTHAELSNLVRYEVLYRHGGVYVDTDVECLRPLTPLLRGIDAFAALEAPGRLGNAVLGAVPGHRVFARAAALARQTLGVFQPRSASTNGPYFLSLIVEQEQGMAIFPAHYFYPYLWDEPERRHDTFPSAYTVHHWTISWLAAA